MADANDEALLAGIRRRIENMTREIEDLEKQDPRPMAKIVLLKHDRRTIRKVMAELAQED